MYADGLMGRLISFALVCGCFDVECGVAGGGVIFPCEKEEDCCDDDSDDDCNRLRIIGIFWGIWHCGVLECVVDEGVE